MKTGLFTAILCAVLLSPLALAQWGGGQCSPVGRLVSVPRVVNDSHEWKASTLPGDEGRWHLFKNGSFVGSWDTDECYFRAYLGGEWGPKQMDPPHALPAALGKLVNRKIEQQPMEPWMLKGVEADKVHDAEKCTFRINGRKVHALEAVGAVLDDDSGKMWLVLTGEQAARDKVLADMKSDPRLKSLLDRTRVWSVPADHFSILDRDSGKPMYPTGSPGIFLGLPDGTQLHKQSGYEGPQDLEALRKADPLYKPDVPDAKKPGPVNPLSPANSFPWMPVCCGAAILAILFYLQRKQSS